MFSSLALSMLLLKYLTGLTQEQLQTLTLMLWRQNCYSFSYNGATLWNSLPCDIRNTESLGVFKRKINDIL